MLNFEENKGFTKYQHGENSGQKVQPKYGSGADPDMQLTPHPHTMS